MNAFETNDYRIRNLPVTKEITDEIDKNFYVVQELESKENKNQPTQIEDFTKFVIDPIE